MTESTERSDPHITVFRCSLLVAVLLSTALSLAGATVTIAISGPCCGSRLCSSTGWSNTTRGRRISHFGHPYLYFVSRRQPPR